MSGISILRKLLMKQAMKESAPFQREGIMSISKTLSGNIDAKVKRWVKSAKKQGQDLDKMSEQEIKYLIELNKPKAPKVYSNEEAYEILNRFVNQGKKDKGKVIEFPKDKITDWTKSQSRPPETEIIGGIQTTRGLGDLFGKQLDRTVNVRIVIEDIKKLEPIEAMKEANKVLRGEGRYKSLSKADREKIVGDESVTDHIFERNIEPEDFAQGGRTGLSYLLAEDTNERMPFKMGRRAFLKLMGGVGAGIGALKAGALKLFGKEGATVAKELTQVPIKNIEGMPSWFKPLVNKVIKEGEEISGDLERVITHKTKLPESKTDVYVTQDLNTGDVVVDIGLQKHGFPDGKFGQPVRLEYKASEVLEGPFKKGQRTKTKEEFNVEEAEFTGGHPENVKFEETSVNEFGDHASDFREVERFATGKNTVTGQFGRNKAAYERNIQKYKRMGKSSTERKIDSFDKQNEDIADYFSNYPNPDDFASGGVAKMLGE